MIEEKQLLQAEQVKTKLFQVYNKRLARVLLGTWLQLVVFGEEFVRKNFDLRTNRYHFQLLVDAGVTWNGKYRPRFIKQKGVEQSERSISN